MQIPLDVTIEMHHLFQGMYACIGAAGAMHTIG
jgi:hypothetical protein